MSIDPKLMARAREALAERREMRSRELARREREVFSRSPAALAITEELASTMRELFALALREDTKDAEIAELEARNLGLQDALRRELVSAGYPGDYIDDTPYCEKCSDSGVRGVRVCSCLEELYKAEQTASLSSLFKLGRESFDTFRIDYYDGDARLAMEGIYKLCMRYAETFGASSQNLFMSGAPGLGKTFLSASIARVVAGNGYSVVYDTFTSIFARLEEEKFSRDTETSGLREHVRRFRECDLLIADDLGTEMTTSFTVSALYELVNTRLITGRKTIISSNLSPEELARRYSPQIASRLAGEYTVLRFYGSDIRLKKRGI